MLISGSSVLIRPCPACDDPSPHLLVELSKDSAVDYYRCQHCRHVWTTSKETGQLVRHITPSPPPKTRGGDLKLPPLSAESRRDGCAFRRRTRGARSRAIAGTAPAMGRRISLPVRTPPRGRGSNRAAGARARTAAKATIILARRSRTTNHEPRTTSTVPSVPAVRVTASFAAPRAARSGSGSAARHQRV